jgi:hypothetical protein
MFLHTRIRLVSLAVAAGALFALSGTSALADERVTNLGPAGENEPILTRVGSKNVIAFYLQDSNRCAVHAVVSDNSGANSLMAKSGPDPAQSALRIRIALNPGQMVHIDTVDNETLHLKCGKNAETLAVVDTGEHIAFGISKPHSIAAGVSNY